jgi:hypothetical protein
MKRLRFTIGELILVVIVVAIGLAAIHSGSAIWAGVMTSIAFFVIITSILGVVFGRGMRRVYWSGFALLGWSYILLAYTPSLRPYVGRFLLAPNLFDYLAEVLHAQGQGGTGGGLASLPVEVLGSLATAGGFGGGTVLNVNMTDFEAIGKAMEALLWAFLGGWVACYFASGQDQERRPARAAGAATAESDQPRGADNATTRGDSPPA